MVKRSTRADEGTRDAATVLLLRSGEGDQEAFAELYDLLAPQVFGLVSCLVRDPAGAEAVTCEAFLETWRRAASYEPDTCSATAWTLLLAHRLAVGARRLSAPATERPTRPHCAHDSRLVEAGLSRAQVDAVQVAYFAGLDHLRIPAVVASNESGTTLLRDGLGLLGRSSSPR